MFTNVKQSAMMYMQINEWFKWVSIYSENTVCAVGCQFIMALQSTEVIEAEHASVINPTTVTP